MRSQVTMVCLGRSGKPCRAGQHGMLAWLCKSSILAVCQELLQAVTLPSHQESVLVCPDQGLSGTLQLLQM